MYIKQDMIKLRRKGVSRIGSMEEERDKDDPVLAAKLGETEYMDDEEGVPPVETGETYSFSQLFTKS